MKIFCFIKKLFLPDTTADTTASRPYYKTQFENLKAIWNNTSYKDFGIERILRLLLQLIAFILPSGLLRQITGTSNFLFRRLGVEFLVVAKLIFLYIVLKFEFASSFTILIIALILTADTLHFSISRIVLNDLYRKHVSYTRSLILTFINFIEVCLFFAVLYSYLDKTNPDNTNPVFIINSSLPLVDNHLTSLQAIYYSFVTAATIGYGDISPKDPFVIKMAVVQIITSLFFVVVFLSNIINRLGGTTFYNEKDQKDTN